MSLMLSSYICYNSRGTIDEHNLQDIGNMVNIGKYLN